MAYQGWATGLSLVLLETQNVFVQSLITGVVPSSIVICSGIGKFLRDESPDVIF